MSKLSDQKYLLTEQYKNASNLNARFQLHERFSTNKYGWHRWVFDQLHLPPSCRILELGCGPGYLWLKNNDRIPDGWEITLSDFSPGMLQEAQQNLSPSDHPFTFEVIDAQSIPFADESFDAIIANHRSWLHTGSSASPRTPASLKHIGKTACNAKGVARYAPIRITLRTRSVQTCIPTQEHGNQTDRRSALVGGFSFRRSESECRPRCSPSPSLDAYGRRMRRPYASLPNNFGRYL